MPIPFHLDRPKIQDGNVCGGVSTGSDTIHIPIREWVPAPAKFLGAPSCVHTVRHTAAKFCTAVKLDDRKFFYRVDHAPALSKFFDTSADARSLYGRYFSCIMKESS